MHFDSGSRFVPFRIDLPDRLSKGNLTLRVVEFGAKIPRLETDNGTGGGEQFCLNSRVTLPRSKPKRVGSIIDERLDTWKLPSPQPPASTKNLFTFTIEDKCKIRVIPRHKSSHPSWGRTIKSEKEEKERGAITVSTNFSSLNFLISSD